jgi:hypothetical protein
MEGKVTASNDLSGYYIKPFKDGQKVTYMILADTNGTPDFLFRNHQVKPFWKLWSFGVRNMLGGFRDAMDYAKNL